MSFSTKHLLLCIGCLLAFLCYGPLFAQSKQEGIHVLHAITKVPVADASIQSEDQFFIGISDENGFVSLKNLSPSHTKITITCIGFEPKVILLPLTGTLSNTSIFLLQPKVSSLEEVRVSASASNGIFKTIGDLDIHVRPINNSQEILRMVPGLFIGQHAGGGKAEQIFLRGFDLDHGTDINISVDGMPVNMVSHAHGQGYADLHFVIPELIDKVNFNKGPYFAEKGNFTTAGFVEFKTKDYLEHNFLRMEAGQFNTYRTIVAWNLLKPSRIQRKQSLYFAGEGSFTKGYFESPQDFNRFNATLKYHGSLSNRTSLSATLTGFTSRWNASGQIPERAVADGSVGFFGAIDNTEGGKTARYNANLELLSNLPNGGVLRNQLFYTKYRFDLFSNFTFFKVDSVNGDQIRQKENRNLFGYNGSYRKDFFIAGLKTETKAGVQVRFDDVRDIELTRTKNRLANTKEISRGNIQELNIASYWSQRLSLTNRLDITAALRADYFKNDYQDQLLDQQLHTSAVLISPKFNLNYRVNDRVELYLYNGRGFHSNDTRVAVQQNGKKVLPPAYGTDIGAVVKLGKKLIVQSALWYLWLDQEFIYVGDEGVVEAGGKTKRMGIDLSVRYEVAKNLFADADFSVANPRSLGVTKTESYLPLAPRFTSAGGITYRKQSGLNGSLRYRYMGDRPANEDFSLTAKGYLILDATLNYTRKHWEAGVSVQNLFNAKWKETQFDTESRLQQEPQPVSEIHFTPGSPFFARASIVVFF